MTAAILRQRNIRIVLVLGAFALLAKAAQLQLFDSSFRKRADATTIDKLTSYPPRGLVFDRNGKLIVNNNAMYDLMVTYSQVNPKMDTMKLCNLLNINKDEFRQRMTKDWRSGKFSKKVPFVFFSKMSDKTYATLQECLYEFPGFFVQVRNIRGYPYSVGAHVLGYINEVDPRDIAAGKGVYAPGDYIGAAGLEFEYEPYLRGKKGATYLLKDNLGRIVDKFQNGEMDTLAVSGSDLVSTIDIDLQAYGEMLMTGKTGSIVALEPRSGEILCMISAPTYDPNRLVMTQERGQVFSELLTDSLKPFFDRTVMAKYPPGSIFKTVVTLAGLQEGTLNPDRGTSCNGGYFYAGRLYKCHNHAHVGNVVDALGYSCNTYYFNEFRNIVDKYGFGNPQKGLDVFTEYCKEFGLGQQLGIDYPNESAGNLPTSAFYDKIYPRKLGGWHSPTIMSMGIGQGELQLTTLQMANLAACIANRGVWYAPRLAKEFKDKNGRIDIKHFQPHKSRVDKRYFDMVVEGMAQCVIRGTAHASAIPDIQICGKTGTSQNPHGEDHSVFFAFAPKENPQIAIAVYVENAGWGGSYAAPIASLMIEKYLRPNHEILPERIKIEERMFNTWIIKRPASVRNTPSIQAARTIPSGKRDSLPEPADLPLDAPPQGYILPSSSGGTGLGRNTGRR